MRILAVAHNTFREAVRDKILYILVFLAVLGILGSKALGWVSIGQDIKIVKDLSLASVAVFGVLIAIFVGTSLIYKEVDKRTLYTILCRPVHRYEFVIGKYLGLSAVLALVTFLMMAMTTVYVLMLGGTVDKTFFLAGLLIYWQLLLVTAFATLMSATASPILGAVVVFSVFVAGHGTNVLMELPEQIEESFGKYILQAIYYLIPNLSNFDIRAEAANGVEVTGAYVLWAMLYGAVYTAMLLVLAAVAFEDKDL